MAKKRFLKWRPSAILNLKKIIFGYVTYRVRSLHLYTKVHRNLASFAALCYASVACDVMRYLSVRLFVRLSVTFVDCIETNKYIFNFFTRWVATPF